MRIRMGQAKKQEIQIRPIAKGLDRDNRPGPRDTKDIGIPQLQFQKSAQKHNFRLFVC